MNNKHLELLRTLSPELFGGNMVHLFGDWSKGPRVIAILYHTLGHHMSNGSNPINMPDIKYFPGFRYTVLDYITPGYNHFYEDVYENQFVLPKMYKNVLMQTQPLTCKVRIKPKQGVLFKEARKLCQNFTDKANSDLATLCTREECEEYTNECYEALTKLLKKANLIDNGCGLNQKKGSVILAEEFNNLLFSQGIILRHHNANKYAESYEQKQKTIKDIVLHKQAMFGELKHDKAKYQQIKENLKQRQK